MLSGHGANPIFLNEKKKKDWTSRTLTNPPLPTSNNILFLPYLPTPLKVDVICVSPLTKLLDNKAFPASFKWSFFLPYNFRSIVFELSIKSSLFVLENCLIISFLRFTFTLTLLLSWRRMIEDRTILWRQFGN